MKRITAFLFCAILATLSVTGCGVDWSQKDRINRIANEEPCGTSKVISVDSDYKGGTVTFVCEDGRVIVK